MANEVGHPSQVALIFARYATRREVWHYPDGRRFANSVFHRLLPLVGLIENSICSNLSFGCAEGVRNTRCPSNPTRYTASLSLDADRPLERLMVAHIIFPKIFFVPH